MDVETIIDWINEHPLEECDIQPREPKPVLCPMCKVAILGTMHDQYGLYMKCSHCDWDSAGLYKTKGMYGKFY